MTTSRPAWPALTRQLERELEQSAAVVNRLRLLGVTAFLALTFVLAVVLANRSWQGNLWWFVAYWAIALATFLASQRSRAFGRASILAIALVDAPMVFVLQYASLATASSASGVAGFTLAIFALLVVFAALSLRDWYIWTTAAIGAALEMTLQALAGVSVGGRVAAFIVLALVAAASSYARRRLVDLVRRVQKDFEERESAEEKLRHAGRMVTVGTLAASVAHEIKNPLTAVLGGLSLARRSAARDGDAPTPALARALDMAQTAADRVLVIVRDMTTFARVDDGAETDVDVNAVIETALAMAQPALKHHVRVVRDLATGVRAFGSELRLGQVFLNLFVNAAHAMSEDDASTNELRVSSRTLADGRVRVDVADTGVGMAADVAARIFEPFYSTKGSDGTGLGLFICHGIVRGLGGEITVESEPGKGTCFRVVLAVSR